MHFLRRPLALAALGITMTGCGACARTRAVEAPPAAPPRLVLMLHAPGLRAFEAEQALTIPTEHLVAGTPGLTDVESISERGLSRLRLTFDAQTPLPDARAAILARLASNHELPASVSVDLAPTAAPRDSGLRYTVESKVEDQGRLRSIQDRQVEQALRLIPGVADVLTCGGLVERVEVGLDAGRLAALHASLDAVVAALATATSAGAEGLEALGATSLGLRDGSPLYLRDVAQLRVGHAERDCLATRDGITPLVEGIVLLQPGRAAAAVAAEVSAKLDQLRAKVLPASVEIRSLDFTSPREETLTRRAAELRVRLATSADTSLTNLAEAVRRSPEVRDLVARRGRLEAGIDLALEDDIELVVDLDPHHQRSLAAVAAEIAERLGALPGVRYDLTAGDTELPRALHPYALRLVGADLDDLRARAREAANVLGRAPGVSGVGVVDSVDEPRIDARIDREAVAAQGLSAAVVELYVEAATGGHAAGALRQAGGRMDLLVRFLNPGGSDAVDFAQIAIPRAGRGAVPLASLVERRVEATPRAILRHNGERYIEVAFNVRGPDPEASLAEAKKRLTAETKGSTSAELEWRTAR